MCRRTSGVAGEARALAAPSTQVPSVTAQGQVGWAKFTSTVAHVRLTVVSRFSPVLEVELNPDQLKYLPGKMNNSGCNLLRETRTKT